MEKPQVVYYHWSYDQSRVSAIWNLNEKGFFCIIHGIDPEVVKNFNMKLGGSSTAQFVIVDLGETSLENAVLIAQTSPQLKGRIVVVGSPPVGQVVPEGVACSPPDKILETILRLQADSH